MMYSMTGYGKAFCYLNNKKVTCEIKTLNSKQIDLSIKIPSFYKDKEMDIRNLLTKELKRGKIELSLIVELTGESGNSVINKQIFKEYYTQIENILKELNKTFQPADIISLLTRMPDIYSTEKETIEESEWNKLILSIKEAIKATNKFRRQEGKAMEKDINNRIDNIISLLKQIDEPEKERIERIKERIRSNLNDYINKEMIDKNRFEQEIIYYLEKLDITEEKVRLKNHCLYFKQTMDSNQSEGKKLGFISQEIGREINTIGSKANDKNIQIFVVQMKDELEKIKEQLLNIL